MNKTYTLATIIVPAETVDTYRSLGAAMSPSGAGVFVVPLYTGEAITHYISTGMIWQFFADMITNPEIFAEAADVSLQEAEAFQAGMTYVGIGTADESGEPVLHNKEAIAHLNLSLTPVYDFD